MTRYLFLFLFINFLPVKSQVKRFHPIKRNLKIERVKKRYKDVYFIYASCDDTLYKIVSFIDKDIKYGEKLKVGNTYTLWIKSMLIDFPPIQNVCVRYGNHFIDLEPDKGIYNIFYSRQLNGKRIINGSNESFTKMGICPDLLNMGLSPYHIKKLREESRGKYGNKELDSCVVLIGLTKYVTESNPPFKRNVKIKKIKRKFKDLYIIDGVCNDTAYTIVSKIKEHVKTSEKIKIGRSYSLTIQPIYPRKINGKENLPPLDNGYYVFNHYVKLRHEEKIQNVFLCEELNGNRIYDDNQ